MTDRGLYKRCPCCGTTEHLGEFVRYAKNGAILQFVACASCGARLHGRADGEQQGGGEGDRAHHRRGNSEGAGHDARRGADMRFEITEVHVVDIPDSEVEEMDNPLEEIKDDAHWFIETYEREAWCEEVTRLGRQL